MENKREENGRTDLLEKLSARMNCQYLSDLRGTRRKNQCRSVLAEIPASDYTVKTWNDAIYYITGEKTDYSIAEDAKNGLICRLEKKNSK